MLPKKDETVFWNRVLKTDGCWFWMRSKVRGYGAFRGQYTHRISWELANGRKIPKGLYVLHRCDVPPCCNPDHLFLGTKLDNARDRDAKGRLNPRDGSKNGNARLTEDDIPFIRHWLGLGYPRKQIAEAFMVGLPAIEAIQSGRNWGHVI